MVTGRAVTVSAVMPTHNMAPYLPAAIESVMAQTLIDWELIIVDDGSPDETSHVLARYRDPRIRVHTLPVNSGRAAARNAALRLARGRYIAICDSDDISVPKRFEMQVSYLDEHPWVDVVSSDVRVFWGGEVSKMTLVFPDTPEKIRRRFERGHMAIAHGACMLRASCFRALGLYTETLQCAEDFELFYRLHRQCHFAKLPEVLLYYRHEPGRIPLRKWTTTTLWRRYAFYLSRQREQQRDRCLSFEQFAKRLDVRAAVWSVDLLRFVKYHLRAHRQRLQMPAVQSLSLTNGREDV